MPATDAHKRKARSSRPWERAKARTLRTKGTVCHLCGQDGADTADHIIPVTHGGHTEPGNLEPSHTECNKARGTLSVEEARIKILTHNTALLPPKGQYRTLPDGTTIDHTGNPTSTQW